MTVSNGETATHSGMEASSPNPPNDASEAVQSVQTDGEGAEAANQKKIEELELQAKEKEAKYVYLYAEFDNFKKRTFKERSELIKFGHESFVRDLLQGMDNLDRALSHMPAGTEDVLAQGLKMVLGQFASCFERHGIKQVESVGKSFDPHLHEAVEQVASDKPVGTILSEHMKGYTIHGRLLRPARVVVSAGQPEAVH